MTAVQQFFIPIVPPPDEHIALPAWNLVWDHSLASKDPVVYRNADFDEQIKRFAWFSILEAPGYDGANNAGASLTGHEVNFTVSSIDGGGTGSYHQYQLNVGPDGVHVSNAPHGAQGVIYNAVGGNADITRRIITISIVAVIDGAIPAGTLTCVCTPSGAGTAANGGTAVFSRTPP